MLYKQYKYKFYLNLNHYVEMDGTKGEMHSHTWEIAMGIGVRDQEFVRFSDIEAYINEMLGKYQDRCINEIPPFNRVNPTLENVCNYLYELVSKGLQKKGWLLYIMEMSETPSRVYQVSGLRPAEDYTFM